MKALVKILKKTYLFDVKVIPGTYGTRYHLIDRAGNVIGWCWKHEFKALTKKQKRLLSEAQQETKGDVS